MELQFEFKLDVNNPLTWGATEKTQHVPVDESDDVFVKKFIDIHKDYCTNFRIAN
jgi:hypothetical protein